MYHSVAESPVIGHLTVTLESFKRQLDYLSRHYALGSVEDVMSDDGQPRAAITFDDGYAHLLDIAVPVLTERKIPATFYIPSGLMGQNIHTSYGATSVMEASDVLNLNNAGFTIGSHSVSHAFLPESSVENVRAELVNSKSELEDVLGMAVPEFAYPKGGYNRNVIEAVNSAGYSRAVTVVSRPVSASDSLFEIPRSGVYQGTSFNRFRFNLSPAGDCYSRLRKLGVQQLG